MFKVLHPIRTVMMLLVTMLLSQVGWGQTTIARDQFETVASTPSMGFSISGGGYQTGSTAASGDAPLSSPKYSEGSRGYGVGNAKAILTSSDINTIGYSNLTFTCKLASFSIGSTGNGADASDSVRVEISPDGGTTYYSRLHQIGNNNLTWAFSNAGTFSTSYATSNLTTNNNAAAASLTITGLPSVSNMRVRITMVNNATSELWVIDDVKITGTSQSTSITTGTITSTSIPSISCTVGSGSKRAIFMTAASSGSAAPVNSTTYTASTDWSSKGTQIGSTGWYCIFNGSTTPSFTVTNLASNTTYRIMVCEYDGAAGSEIYNTYASGTGNPANFLTTSGSVSPEPTNQVTSLAKGAVTTSAIPLTWTAAATGSQAPDGYLVKLSTTSVSDPVDGTDPSDVTAVTSGAANKKVTPGSATSATSFTSMSAGTMYYYKVFSYTNSGSSIDFNLTSAPSLNVATLPTEVTGASVTATGSSTADIAWTAASGYDGTKHSTLVFIKSGSAVTVGTPSNAPSTYTANTSFSSGTAYQGDASAYCVYNGDGTSVSVTGLTGNTTYHVLIYTVVESSNSDATNSYSAGVTANGTTAKIEPTNQASSLAKGSITTTTLPITWTAAVAGSQSPDGYLLKLSTGTITAPSDGTDPGAGSLAISSSAASYKSTGTSATFTSATAGTMYTIQMFSYTNSGTLINFNTTSAPSINVATKPIAVTGALVTATGSTTADIAWTAASGYDGTKHSTLVFIKSGSAVTAGTPSNAPSTYTANTAFSSGTAYQGDASAYCVYNGDGTSVSVTGLTANTTYHVLIYTVMESSNTDATNSYSASVTANGTTLTIPVTIPYSQDFEGASSDWSLQTTGTNIWAIGSAAYNGGSKALYISNDGGTSNAYTLGTSQSGTDASLRVDLTGVTSATLSFYWKSNGEATFDYGEVWINAGASDILLSSSKEFQGTSAYGKKEISLNTYLPAGVVTIKFRWVNDGSGGSNPPFSVDDIKIYVPMSVPVANAASSIACSSFVANWSSISGSTEYRLDVATASNFAPTSTLSEGFSGGATAPTNWTFTNIGATYTSAGNYGAASPSLSLDASNDQLVTPTLSSAATELSFWIKGNGTNATSALKVEGYNGSSWVTIDNITNSIPTSGTTKTYNSTSNPAMDEVYTQFRFTYTKSSGNLAFDDVAITYGSTYVSGFKDKVVNSTSQSVTGLAPNTTYFYRVRAVNSYQTTSNSNTITVSTYSTFASGAISTTGETICYGGTPTNIGSATAASGGDNSISYSWRSSADNYTAAISDATSATYTPPDGLTTTTSYRRYSNDGACNTTPTVSTGTWTVTVRPQYTTGEISATGETICYGGTPVNSIGSTTAASGGDNSIAYTWRSSADSYTTAISGATLSTYTPPAGLTATTSYRRYAKDATCNTTPTVSTGTWTVTVRPQYTTGTIQTTGETTCYGGTPSTAIGSSVDASGGDNSITYSWRSSADSYAAAISGATASTFTPPAGLTTTTSYRRYAKDATCNTTPAVSTGTWMVTVLSTFTTGEISATGETICYAGTPATAIGSTTDASGGDNSITYSWRSSADSYTASISGATSSTYTPPAGLTVTTSYRRYAKDATCNTTPTVSTGTWTVTVRPQLTTGEIDATGETICYGGSPSTTIGNTTAASGGDNSITYSWRSSTDGFLAAISGATSSTYTPPASAMTATTSYKRYAKDGTCNTTPTASTGTWTVTVNPHVWTGGVSTDWNNAANWNCNVVPPTGAHIEISSSATNKPVLDASRTVGNLKLTDGLITLGSSDLTVIGTITGAGVSSYIRTDGAGKLIRNNITSSTLFPIGKAKYNPITVNNSDGLNWSVSADDGVTPNTGFSADAAVLMTWNITPSTTPTPNPTSITFQFDGTYPGGQVGSLYSSATRLQAFRRNRYDEYWFGSGGTLEFPNATNVTATTVTINGLTGFSKYALSNVGSPLPVSLLSFSGYKDGTRNQLRWVTASESNNRGFEVERSADGRTYQSIGFVNSLAVGGNSQSQLRYSFTDLTPGGTKQYYRLKQSDIDGRSTLSNILVIQGEKPTALEIASVFPNPSSGQVTVLLNAPSNDNVNIRLLDMAGRILETRSISVLTGINPIPFDLSKWAKGQYFIAVGEKVVRVVRE